MGNIAWKPLSSDEKLQIDRQYRNEVRTLKQFLETPQIMQELHRVTPIWGESYRDVIRDTANMQSGIKELPGLPQLRISERTQEIIIDIAYQRELDELLISGIDETHEKYWDCRLYMNFMFVQMENLARGRQQAVPFWR